MPKQGTRRERNPLMHRHPEDEDEDDEPPKWQKKPKNPPEIVENTALRHQLKEQWLDLSQRTDRMKRHDRDVQIMCLVAEQTGTDSFAAVVAGVFGYTPALRSTFGNVRAGFLLFNRDMSDLQRRLQKIHGDLFDPYLLSDEQAQRCKKNLKLVETDFYNSLDKYCTPSQWYGVETFQALAIFARGFPARYASYFSVAPTASMQQLKTLEEQVKDQAWKKQQSKEVLELFLKFPRLHELPAFVSVRLWIPKHTMARWQHDWAALLAVINDVLHRLTNSSPAVLSYMLDLRDLLKEMMHLPMFCFAQVAEKTEEYLDILAGYVDVPQPNYVYESMTTNYMYYSVLSSWMHMHDMDKPGYWYFSAEKPDHDPLSVGAKSGGDKVGVTYYRLFGDSIESVSDVARKYTAPHSKVFTSEAPIIAVVRRSLLNAHRLARTFTDLWVRPAASAKSDEEEGYPEICEKVLDFENRWNNIKSSMQWDDGMAVVKKQQQAKGTNWDEEEGEDN